MAFVCSLIFGILSLLAMLLSIKYYLPVISKKAAEANTTSPDSSPEEKKEPELAVQPKKIHLAFIILLTIFALGTGFMAYTNCTDTISLVKLGITFTILSVTLVTDWSLHVIPNLCCIALLGARLLVLIPELIIDWQKALYSLANGAIAMVIMAFFLLVMSKITRGGLGMGDIKLYCCIGFMCGIRAVCYSLLFGMILLTLAALALMIIKQYKLKDEIPMGPFILLGYGLTIILSLA